MQTETGMNPNIAIVILASVCCLLIYASHLFTQDKIHSNKIQQQLALLNTVINQAYDNEPLEDAHQITIPSYFGSDNTVDVYPISQSGQARGIVLQPVLARGYNGLIELMIGFDAEGSMMGVKVLRHNETENLGDKIHQNKSAWLENFRTLSIENTVSEKWALKNEGGRIDQLSGATTSAHAVIHAVKHVLEYYQYNKEEFIKQHAK